MHVIVMPRHALEILFRPLSLDQFTHPGDAQRKIKVHHAFRRPAWRMSCLDEAGQALREPVPWQVRPWKGLGSRPPNRTDHSTVAAIRESMMTVDMAVFMTTWVPGNRLPRRAATRVPDSAAVRRSG